MSERSPASIARFYLKIFLACGIPFGVFMALFLGVLRNDGDWVAMLRRGLLLGAIYGGGMSVTLGTLALVLTPRGAVGARQRRSSDVPGERTEVLERVRTALARLPKAGDVRLDLGTGTVETKTGFTWRSWGEVVVARVQPVGPVLHRVEVESRPRVRTTLVDYGKATMNVEHVLGALRGERPRHRDIAPPATEAPEPST